jgi:hypothetical protein
MRTTLDIAPDVLLAAKDLAARSGTRNGFPLLPATGQSITSELIKSLIDEEV